MIGALRVSVVVGDKSKGMVAPLISLKTGNAMALRMEAQINLMARLVHCLRALTKMAVATVDVDVDDVVVVAVVILVVASHKPRSS